MTPAIAKSMRELEEMRDEHTGPTGRPAQVPAVVIVGAERGRICWQRVHWATYLR